MKTIKIDSPKYGIHDVLVDDEDYENVIKYTWHVNYHNDNVYAITGKRAGKSREDIKMHRMILGYPTSRIDHRDGNGLNNQKNNLRLASVSQNTTNTGKNSRNTSGYKGVTFHKRDKTWQMSIKSGGVAYYSTGHKTALDAAKKYNEFAKKLHGEFAALNKLPDGTNS